MPFTTVQKNVWLDSISPGFVSAHTADPGQSGASEVTGGTPAYARKAITMAAAAAGQRDSSPLPGIDIPAGATVTHIGFWTLATGGVFLGSKAVTNETGAGQWIYKVTDADLSITDPA
jgi:hypothetical protein